jgi:perosamine synthetase
MSETDEKSPFRPAWPPTTPEIEAELQRLLRDQTWGLYEGECADRLRAKLSSRFQQDHVYLCSSGTLAVELALRGMAIGPGDEVILSGYDFPGNFRAIEAVGATPVLVDVEADGWAIGPELLEEAISDATRVIMASHLHGSMVDMPRVMRIAASRNVQVLEDACQVPGGVVQGRPAGSWGDVAVLSFGGSKLLSAGRGGAVLTRQPQILQRLKIYGERGNLAFPLSELQAAVLLPQLDQLDEGHQRRKVAVERLATGITEWRPVCLVSPTRSGDSPAYYKWGLAVENAAVRESLLREFKDQGVPIDIGFRGFAKRSSRRCRRVGDLRSALHRSEGTLLLHHPVLLENERVLDALIASLISAFSRCL